MVNALPYIPQKPPIVMVDNLLECSEKGADTQFTVQPENIFVQNGYLVEPKYISRMAEKIPEPVNHQISVSHNHNQQRLNLQDRRRSCYSLRSRHRTRWSQASFD